ncbi:hypothetical protein CKAN_00949800 [Cinnamomum micranthum f. kanehirae]|uniref:Uncharacterized protein n=1 Tax=Cinnamomum micranthum f. kanehirae TaxID=337451 RepID=A0A443NQP4_9MAGN|nr:hypothetical protein CKAN_00949800 [Cinnamomum micranthum f. kanehirae]
MNQRAPISFLLQLLELNRSPVRKLKSRKETCIQDADDNAFSHVSIIHQIARRVERLAKVIPASSCMKLVKAIRYHAHHTRKLYTINSHTQINAYIKLDKLGVIYILHVLYKRTYV